LKLLSQLEVVCHLEKEQAKKKKNSLERSNYHPKSLTFWIKFFHWQIKIVYIYWVHCDALEYVNIVRWANVSNLYTLSYLHFKNLPHLAPTVHWRNLSGNRHTEESNCTRGCCRKTIPKLVFNKEIHRPPKSKIQTFHRNYICPTVPISTKIDGFPVIPMVYSSHRKSVARKDGA
jgi:hypothetical protein